MSVTVPGPKEYISQRFLATYAGGYHAVAGGDNFSRPIMGLEQLTDNLVIGNAMPLDLTTNTGGILFKTGTGNGGGYTGATTKVTITRGGDMGIGTTTPRAKLDVDGGVKVANDTDTAIAVKAGTLRYRYLPDTPKSQSKVDMCMQTGPSTYAWVNIVTNTWNN